MHDLEIKIGKSAQQQCGRNMLGRIDDNWLAGNFHDRSQNVEGGEPNHGRDVGTLPLFEGSLDVGPIRT